MPYSGLQTFTGEGSFDLGGNVNVSFINHWVSVLGRTQVLTLGDPKRIMHAGWIGLGYSGGVITGGPPSIQWYKYLEFESESLGMAIVAGGAVNCDHLYYHLEVGVTLQVFMGW